MNKIEILQKRLPEGVDAFLTTDSVTRFYLTGFKSSNGFLFVTKSGAHFFTDFRYIEAAEKECIGCTVSAGNRKEALAKIVAEENIKTIAFEDDIVTVAALEGLKKEFAGAAFVSIGDAVKGMMEFKTPEEMAKVRKAQEITDKAFAAVLPLLRPDMMETDVAAELEYQMKKFGASDKSFDTIAVSGTNSARPHGVPRPVQLEKGFLTSSCCPAFVTYVKRQFPDLAPYISHNLSPAAAFGKLIKEKDPMAKVVFIGPCTAKKMEMKQEEQGNYVDCVLTFEELQALLSAKDIELQNLPEESLEGASYYGRIFGRSGGLSEAVTRVLQEKGIEDFDLKAVTCDGIDACRVALLKASKRVLDGNFIEGMACLGGCIGGAGCLTHGERNSMAVEQYGKKAGDVSVLDAARAIEEKPYR